MGCKQECASDNSYVANVAMLKPHRPALFENKVMKIQQRYGTNFMIQNALYCSGCKRQYEPVRKMSIIQTKKVTFEILGESIDMEVQESPTFGTAIK